MEHTFQELLQCHTPHLRLKGYKNEFEAMKEVISEESLPIRRTMSFKWLLIAHASNKCDIKDMERKSNTLREEGNKFYKAQKVDKQNILRACQLYTEAIFAAPAGSASLPLAHANRAIALQDFEYFQEAYDDCQSARILNYPKDKMPKILLRQAHCCWKMKDPTKLETHLNELEVHTLNESIMQQVEALKSELIKLNQQEAIEIDENIQQKKAQTIITAPAPRGRHMIASESIKAGEIVFIERATSFVPTDTNTAQICQQCAKTQFIPFPCYYCHGEVVYCSLKCLIEHGATHVYECFAYQQKLFAKIGIGHLALRIVLDELPKVLPLLKDKPNADEIWAELRGKNSTLEKKKVDYLQTLHLITHLDKMTLEDILWFALVSDFLLVYLKEFTTFFKLMQNANASQEDWELIVGSLILLHIGQLTVNATSCITIARYDCNDKFSLLSESLWSSPYHVQRGSLYNFCHYHFTISANFPYLSICNHSCDRSFQPKPSGRFICAYALNDIACGEEIFNCYMPDYRQSKRCERQAELESHYQMKCECSKCKRLNPDEDFEKFHRYRCQNPYCNKIFVPYLPHLPTLQWWLRDADTPFLKCTYCGVSHDISWLPKFYNLLECIQSEFSRRELVKNFNKLDKILVGNNELKMFFAINMARKFLAAHNDGCTLKNAEFVQLVPIIKFYMSAIAEQCDVNSVEYVAPMLLLWDIIALGKYKCSQQEMQNMLKAIEIVSDEFKMIFINYYEDYIKSILI